MKEDALYSFFYGSSLTFLSCNPSRALGKRNLCCADPDPVVDFELRSGRNGLAQGNNGKKKHQEV